MSVIVLLIFASLAMATAFLISFIWAVRSGQYEDTSTPSMRVLMDDGQKHRSQIAAPPQDSGESLQAEPTLRDADSSKIKLHRSNPGVVANKASILDNAR